MPSEKRLISVCHNIAHQAASGLSFVHPHALAACLKSGAESITADLLASEPCPECFRGIDPLRLSLKALRAKFESILSTEGFSSTDLALK